MLFKLKFSLNVAQVVRFSTDRGRRPHWGTIGHFRQNTDDSYFSLLVNPFKIKPITIPSTITQRARLEKT